VFVVVKERVLDEGESIHLDVVKQMGKQLHQTLHHTIYRHTQRYIKIFNIYVQGTIAKENTSF
jgi:hypothetical protein